MGLPGRPSLTGILLPALLSALPVAARAARPGCGQPEDTQPGSSTLPVRGPIPAGAGSFVPGRVLVGFEAGAGEQGRRTAAAAVDGRVLAGKGRTRVVELDQGADVRAVSRRLADRPGVAFAEPSRPRPAAPTCRTCSPPGRPATTGYLDGAQRRRPAGQGPRPCLQPQRRRRQGPLRLVGRGARRLDRHLVRHQRHRLGRPPDRRRYPLLGRRGRRPRRLHPRVLYTGAGGRPCCAPSPSSWTSSGRGSPTPGPPPTRSSPGPMTATATPPPRHDLLGTRPAPGGHLPLCQHDGGPGPGRRHPGGRAPAGRLDREDVGRGLAAGDFSYVIDATGNTSSSQRHHVRVL
jgi:hypothetical protein